MAELRESDLFEPVCKFLESNGFAVRGEVKGADIVAAKDDVLVAVELKKSFCLKLLYQAIERQSFADSVYVAIPRPAKCYGGDWHSILALTRKLELGLIVVSFIQGVAEGAIVDIAVEPADYKSRRSHQKRHVVIDEMKGRTLNLNKGGVTRTKLMTAYRENALRIAAALHTNGVLSPSELVKMGCSSKAGSILQSNFDGWFCKVSRGKYAVTEQGIAALAKFRELFI